jgi:uncharacterized protein with von Willebrand factor type A (vWA) domain
MAGAASQTSSDLNPAVERGSQRGYLLAQLLRFGRLLRVMGVETSLAQMLGLVEALEYVSIADRLDFYCASRALLVSCREDIRLFDQAFAIFWNSRAGAGARPPGSAKEPEARPPLKRARLPRSESPEVSIDRPGGKAEPIPSKDSDDSQDASAPVAKIAYYSPI